MSKDTQKTDFIVGAYASLPSGRQAQEQYYELLANQPWINGIEIPYPGDLAQNLAWLAAQLPAHWEANTITAIPGTMQNVGKNAAFGLASTDPDGKQAALEFTEQIRQCVVDLADKKGKKVIAAVQLHSAPTNGANAPAFTASLEKLQEQDWAGAKLVIEHCDAPRAGRKPEKGFLELADEIAIARQTGVKIHINWGRSCLEERDAQAPLAHIRAAAKEQVLAGVLFSGAGPADTQYGYEWIDGHLPMSPDEPTSLLTAQEVAECAQDGAGAQYLGAKICVPAQATLEQRLAMLRHIYDAAQQQ